MSPHSNSMGRNAFVWYPLVSRECSGCQATLVTREGRYGEFMACPNWPKCQSRNTSPCPSGVQITDVHWDVDEIDEDLYQPYEDQGGFW